MEERVKYELLFSDEVYEVEGVKFDGSNVVRRWVEGMSRGHEANFIAGGEISVMVRMFGNALWKRVVVRPRLVFEVEEG